MSEKIKISDKIILIITALLLILYCLSFTKSCSSTDKREVVKSALVNQKYAEDIDAFQFIQGNSVLLLSKKNGMWYVDSSEIQNISLPADNERVNRFIADLISIQEMYKLSDTIDENSSFGLDDQDTFTLRYYTGVNFKDIIFGNKDFALSSRYMMSGKSTAVFEISNVFDKYLSTATQLWTEPYIISQQILGPIKESDIQRTFVTFDNVTKQTDFDSKLLELRHGGFPSAYSYKKEMFENSLMSIKLELGNKNNIELSIAQSENNNEQEFNVKTSYFADGKEIYRSYSKISGWTYNKIKEIML